MRRDIFQAIADPTRRAIILLIAFRDMTPKGISEHFVITRQAISQHLRLLTACGLLKQDHRGREIYYRIEPDKMTVLEIWITQFRQIRECRLTEPDRVPAIINGNTK